MTPSGTSFFAPKVLSRTEFPLSALDEKYARRVAANAVGTEAFGLSGKNAKKAAKLTVSAVERDYRDGKGTVLEAVAEHTGIPKKNLLGAFRTAASSNGEVRLTPQLALTFGVRGATLVQYA